jgi:hypothetical protein
MKNLEYFQKRSEIGAAVWLLNTYWAVIDPDESYPDERPWHRVLNGEPIADAEAAALLKVSVQTASRWRRRLIRIGVVEAESCGEGFRIRVQRPEFATVTIRAMEAHGAERGSWPKMATELVQ